mmetsp:Transcript_71942/g.192108  ORF Transcript_71942/g.192108 Transcript_71942/m.192108 type:complete len:98 (+) Transcript_71942:409-702(+)
MHPPPPCAGARIVPYLPQACFRSETYGQGLDLRPVSSFSARSVSFPNPRATYDLSRPSAPASARGAAPPKVDPRANSLPRRHVVGVVRPVLKRRPRP